MRTNIKILLLVLTAILINESVFPTKMYKAPVKTQHAFTDYTWFTDADMTDPTGTISDIYVEISRLQALYSGYTFSSLPGGGLHDFEYGWNAYYDDVVIYSNR
jgi:hypothetical protein